MSSKSKNSIWTSFFSPDGSQNEKKSLELNARISLLTQKLNHEQMKRDTTYQELKKAKRELKKKSSKKVPLAFTRLVKKLQTQDSLITVYESSLLALEEMNANILAQQISSDTTQLLRKTTRALRGGINVDEVDDDFAAVDEFREQREELAAMMAQDSSGQSLEEFMDALEFSSDDEDTEPKSDAILTENVKMPVNTNRLGLESDKEKILNLPSVPEVISRKEKVPTAVAAEF